MSKMRSSSAKGHPVSHALRQMILHRGLTAYATAKRAGVSVDAVHRFLKDQRGLNLETVDKIADSLALKLCEDDSAVPRK